MAEDVLVTYKVGESIYQIPASNQEKLLEKYPDAERMSTFNYGGEDYYIPNQNAEKFISKYPDAEPMDNDANIFMQSYRGKQNRGIPTITVTEGEENGLTSTLAESEDVSQKPKASNGDIATPQPVNDTFFKEDAATQQQNIAKDKKDRAIAEQIYNTFESKPELFKTVEAREKFYDLLASKGYANAFSIGESMVSGDSRFDQRDEKESYIPNAGIDYVIGRRRHDDIVNTPVMRDPAVQLKLHTTFTNAGEGLQQTINTLNAGGDNEQQRSMAKDFSLLQTRLSSIQKAEKEGRINTQGAKDAIKNLSDAAANIRKKYKNYIDGVTEEGEQKKTFEEKITGESIEGKKDFAGISLDTKPTQQKVKGLSKDAREKVLSTLDDIESLYKKFSSVSAQSNAAYVNRPENQYQLATALSEMGKFKESNKILGELLNKNAASYQIYQAAAYNYYQLGDNAAARSMQIAAQQRQPISDIPSNEGGDTTGLDMGLGNPANPQYGNQGSPTPASEEMGLIVESLRHYAPIYSNAANISEGWMHALEKLKKGGIDYSKLQQAKNFGDVVKLGVSEGARIALNTIAGFAEGLFVYSMNTTPVGLAFVEATQGLTSEGVKATIGKVGAEAFNYFRGLKGSDKVTPDEVVAAIMMPVTTVLQGKEMRGAEIPEWAKDVGLIADVIAMHLFMGAVSKLKGTEEAKTAQDILDGKEVTVEHANNLFYSIVKSVNEEGGVIYKIQHEYAEKLKELEKAVADFPETREVLQPEIEATKKKLEDIQGTLLHHDILTESARVEIEGKETALSALKDAIEKQKEGSAVKPILEEKARQLQEEIDRLEAERLQKVKDAVDTHMKESAAKAEGDVLDIKFGDYVDYGGVKGRVERRPDGVVVVTPDGKEVLVEGGFSGKRLKDLGLKKIEEPKGGEPKGGEPKTEPQPETEVEQGVAEVKAPDVKFNFEENTVTVDGKKYTYDGVGVDKDGNTTSIRVIDENGNVRHLRNEEVVFEIELQKETAELGMIEKSEVEAAAKELNIKEQKNEKETRGTPEKQQGVVEKLQPAEQAKAVEENKGEQKQEQLKTQDDAVQEQKTKGVDVRQQAADGEAVGERNAKGQEITDKGEAEKIKKQIAEENAKSEWQKEQEAIDNDSSLSEAEKEKKKIESTAKQKSDPDLANIDPVIIAARNGDKQAQKKLEEYGLDWEQTTTYRFVGQPEVDVLLSDKKVESKRFSDAGIDVTTSPKVTSAANAEYRVTFKESFDVNNGLGKVKVKSKEEGDHNLEKGRGYTLNDVAKIERLDENGNVVEVIYDSESLLSKEQQPIDVSKEEGSGVGGDVEAKINKVADEYLYHGTGEGAFRRIREEGLTPQGEKYLYFADKEQYAKTYAQRKGNSFGDRVLRVKKSDAYLPDENTTGGDFKIKNKINPNDIEIKHNGKWIPIQEFADENIGIMPISKAVEQSIKETTKAETPTTTKESNVVEGSGGVGGDIRSVNDFANENESYRVIVGDGAFNDIVESGTVRTNAGNKGGESLSDKLKNRPTLFPSFSKGKASMEYAAENPNNYIIVTEDASIQPSKAGRHGKGTTMFPTDENGNHLKELSGEKVKVYKHIGEGQYVLVYANGKVVEQSLKETPKAEADGSNPELVAAVEDLLGKQKESSPTPQTGKGEREVKQQIETFGVPKQDVEPVHNVITQVFDGLKKAGLTAAKTVGEWVGIGKGEAKPYTLKINGEEKTVKPVNAEVVNGFYSPLEKTINETKFDKLPAKQWIDKFAKGEEAKWTGLSDWLAQQQGSVSKADIQKYLKDNRIQVVEVVKGEDARNYRLKTDPPKDLGIDRNEALDILGKAGDLNNPRLPEFMERRYGRSGEDILEWLKENAEDIGTYSKDTKFETYQLEGEKSNYKEVLVTMPNNSKYQNELNRLSKKYNAEPNYKSLRESEATDSELEFLRGLKTEDFKSSHFDEPNILVHLRMNTRTDAEGNKVLFLEEVQSDWGQKGKKEGFLLTEKEAGKAWEEADKKYADFMNRMEKKYGSEWESELTKDEVNEEGKLLDARENTKGGNVPQSPFVTDTNAWTKLGLKTALKEAVAQGAERIAWTTGEQQNERYDLSKQVDDVYTSSYGEEWVNGKYEKRKDVEITLKGGDVKKFVVDDNGKIQSGAFVGERLDSVIGKEMAEKILSAKEDTNFGSQDLKVGGKGMKGFYGEPSEGKEGIVGGVAKALVKELTGKPAEIVETKVKLADKLASGYDVTIKDENGRVTTHNFDTKSQGLAWLSKQKNIEVISEKAEGIETSTQHSIEITPELKAAVEKGQPLFKEAEAQYRIESGKNIIEAIKDFDGSPRATVALTHEIMHPTVVEIFNGAKEGNETGVRHANTIVEEYNKANPSKKVTLNQMIDGNDSFINGRTTPEYRAVQEFIAEAWEKYHHEGAKGFSKAFQEALDAITEAFRQVYKSLTGVTLTPELRKMFDELLGKKDVSKEGQKQGKETEQGRYSTKVEGKHGIVKFADGVSVPFRYRLIEEEDVQASHLASGERNPEHSIALAQPKERNDMGSKLAQDKIADNPNLGEVGDSPNAFFGAPIVTKRGEVVQGNNRTIGLKKHYNKGGESYKGQLEKNAEQFGFTKEQVSKMKKPILVREVLVDDNVAVELGNYDVKDLETGGKQRLDSVATVRKMNEKDKGRLASLIFDNEYKTIKDGIRENAKRVLDVIGGYLNAAQRNTIIDKDGNITPKGMDDIEAVIHNLIFDNGDASLPEIFDNLSYVAQKNIQKALKHIYSVSEENSLRPEIHKAMMILYEFEQSSNPSFESWANQFDMFKGVTPKDIFTPLELKIAKLLHEATNQSTLSKQLGEYSELVNGKAADMFTPATKGISKTEAINKQFKVEYNERTSTTEGANAKTKNIETQSKESDREALPPKKGLEVEAEQKRDTNAHPSIEKTLVEEHGVEKEDAAIVTSVLDKLNRGLQSMGVSFDITKGLQLGKGKEGSEASAHAQFRIEKGKRIVEILKSDLPAKEKATAILHEVGHLSLHELLQQHIDGSTPEIKKTLDTMIKAFNESGRSGEAKKRLGGDVTIEKLIEEHNAFKEQGEKINAASTEALSDNIPNFRDFHEFITDSLNKYLKDGTAGFGKEFDAVLQKIKELLVHVYDTVRGGTLEGLTVSPELKQVFDRMLGKDVDLFKEPEKPQAKPLGEVKVDMPTTDEQGRVMSLSEALRMAKEQGQIKGKETGGLKHSEGMSEADFVAMYQKQQQDNLRAELLGAEDVDVAHTAGEERISQRQRKWKAVTVKEAKKIIEGLDPKYESTNAESVNSLVDRIFAPFQDYIKAGVDVFDVASEYAKSIYPKDRTEPYAAQKAAVATVLMTKAANELRMGFRFADSAAAGSERGVFKRGTLEYDIAAESLKKFEDYLSGDKRVDATALAFANSHINPNEVYALLDAIDNSRKKVMGEKAKSGRTKEEVAKEMRTLKPTAEEVDTAAEKATAKTTKVKPKRSLFSGSTTKKTRSTISVERKKSAKDKLKSGLSKIQAAIPSAKPTPKKGGLTEEPPLPKGVVEGVKDIAEAAISEGHYTQEAIKDYVAEKTKGILDRATSDGIIDKAWDGEIKQKSGAARADEVSYAIVKALKTGKGDAITKQLGEALLMQDAEYDPSSKTKRQQATARLAEILKDPAAAEARLNAAINMVVNQSIVNPKMLDYLGLDPVDFLASKENPHGMTMEQFEAFSRDMLKKKLYDMAQDFMGHGVHEQRVLPLPKKRIKPSASEVKKFIKDFYDNPEMTDSMLETALTDHFDITPEQATAIASKVRGELADIVASRSQKKIDALAEEISDGDRTKKKRVTDMVVKALTTNGAFGDIPFSEKMAAALSNRSVAPADINKILAYGRMANATDSSLLKAFYMRKAATILSKYDMSAASFLFQGLYEQGVVNILGNPRTSILTASLSMLKTMPFDVARMFVTRPSTFVRAVRFSKLIGSKGIGSVTGEGFRAILNGVETVRNRAEIETKPQIRRESANKQARLTSWRYLRKASLSGNDPKRAQLFILKALQSLTFSGGSLRQNIGGKTYEFSPTHWLVNLISGLDVVVKAGLMNLHNYYNAERFIRESGIKFGTSEFTKKMSEMLTTDPLIFDAIDKQVNMEVADAMKNGIPLPKDYVHERKTQLYQEYVDKDVVSQSLFEINKSALIGIPRTWLGAHTYNFIRSNTEIKDNEKTVNAAVKYIFGSALYFSRVGINVIERRGRGIPFYNMFLAAAPYEFTIDASGKVVRRTTESGKVIRRVENKRDFAFGILQATTTTALAVMLINNIFQQEDLKDEKGNPVIDPATGEPVKHWVLNPSSPIRFHGRKKALTITEKNAVPAMCIELTNVEDPDKRFWKFEWFPESWYPMLFMLGEESDDIRYKEEKLQVGGTEKDNSMLRSVQEEPTSMFRIVTTAGIGAFNASFTTPAQTADEASRLISQDKKRDAAATIAYRLTGQPFITTVNPRLAGQIADAYDYFKEREKTYVKLSIENTNIRSAVSNMAQYSMNQVWAGRYLVNNEDNKYTIYDAHGQPMEREPGDLLFLPAMFSEDMYYGWAEHIYKSPLYKIYMDDNGNFDESVIAIPNRIGWNDKVSVSDMVKQQVRQKTREYYGQLVTKFYGKLLSTPYEERGEFIKELWKAAVNEAKTEYGAKEKTVEGAVGVMQRKNMTDGNAKEE